MKNARSRRSLSAARRFLALTTVGLTVMAATPLLAPQASAVSRVVECTGSNDIGKVQSAVDASASGDSILLRGTCDFRNANAHGGSTSSIAAAAVVIRPGSPVTDLTIASADGPQEARIVGSGTQAAFAVAPGNDRLTIRGLEFANLGRPIVVLGADDVTIGATGGTPSPEGNHVFGGISQTSAILAVASDQPATFLYGDFGNAGSVTVTPGDLTGLTVEGNYIQYAPPGPGDPTGNSDVVAVDVRQKGLAVVSDVDITHNATGMFTSDFASFSQNSVRVQGLTAVPASVTPSPADYRITGVRIVDNNFGRLEEIDPSQLPEDVDPGDAHAGGRVGVVLHRVADYEVAGNELRSRISITGPSGMPGGGVLVADSGFGSVHGNDILTLSDPATSEARDAGAIGVIDDLDALFGVTSLDQATTENVVASNRIARLVPVRRGLVLAGADKVTAFGNTIGNSSAAAVNIGADLQGPGGAAPIEVTRSVVCENLLGLHPVDDLDRADEVAYRGTANSTGNAFPGGAASTPGDNNDCPPAFEIHPAPPAAITTADPLVVTGRTWASRDSIVTVTDDLDVSTSKTVTANAVGDFSVTFTATDLAGLADGLVRVEVTATDPSGFQLSSEIVTGILDIDSANPDAGDVVIGDGGDGYSNSVEVLSGLPVYWTAPVNPVQTAELWFSDANGVIPNEPLCGPFAGQPKTGAIFFPVECATALPQGTYRFNVRWTAADGSQSAVAFDSSILDTRNVQPTITSPAESATFSTPAVTFTGTAEANAQVNLQTSTRVPLGSTTADGTGSWTLTLNLDNGTHRISAYSIDVAGNRSSASPLRTIHVNTAANDTIPPAPPIIANPLNGGLYTTLVPFTGTAEALAKVDLYLDGNFMRRVNTGPGGAWGDSVLLPTGTYTVTAIAEDAAGNRSTPSAAVTFTVDADKPELEITTPEDAILLLEEVVIDGRVRDNDSAVSVQVEYYDVNRQLFFIADPATCKSPGCPTPAATWVDWTHNGNQPTVGGPRRFFPPGIYYAVAIATDRAGNVAKDSVRFIVVQP